MNSFPVRATVAAIGVLLVSPGLPIAADRPSLVETATTAFDVPKIQTGPHLSPLQTEVLELMA